LSTSASGSAIAFRLVSFDLYFLAREPGQSWEDAMAELEDVDELPLDDASLGRWERVRASLTSVLPDAKEFAGDTNRELSDDATGIQVSMFARELSLTVPYWYSGPDAERLVGLLREVVAAIEGATGLTAYDPQADAPFLGEGEHSAASTLDRTRRSVTEAIQHNAETGSADSPQESDRPPGLWARLFGREPR